MIDRPDAPTLLQAMAETLSDEVLPATEGAARHSVRVVANLCRIVERELRAGTTEREDLRMALAALLGRAGSLDDLVRVLDRRLADPGESDPAFLQRATVLVAEDVRRRLAIDCPGYDG